MRLRALICGAATLGILIGCVTGAQATTITIDTSGLNPAAGVYSLDFQLTSNEAPTLNTATISNLVSHQWLFRLGMIDELLCAILLVLLVLSLQRLLEGVDRHLAMLVVILGGVLQAAISLVNVANDAGALRIATDSNFLPAFEGPQRTSLAMLLLKLHDYETDASLMLSGAWLFPLGTLVYRSRFLPRWLGVWLLLGGVGWLVLFLTAMLAPEYQDKVLAYAQPVFFGEIALTLWLLVRGASPPEKQTH